MTIVQRRGVRAIRLVLALGAALLTPQAAFAHGRLKSSTPADRSRLTAAPPEVRLVFTEAPELAFSRIELTGPNGPVRLGALTRPTDVARALAAPIGGALAAGDYTVAWQMAGADGHPVRGTLAFSIEAGATGLGVAHDVPAAAPGANGAAMDTMMGMHHDPRTMPEGGAFDAESPAYAAVRWLQYVGLLLVIGALAFHYAVLGFLRRKQHPDSPMLPDARNQAARIGVWAAAVLLASALLRLVAQSYALEGSFDTSQIGAMIGGTLWGKAFVLQLVGSTLAIAGFAMARHAPGEEGTSRTRTGWTLAALGALIAAFTPALAGHAAAVPERSGLAITADALHVIGAGGWLGSLLFVLAAGIPAAMRLEEPRRWQGVADVVGSFSPTALIFAGLAGMTGVFAAWLHLGQVSALWGTRYGLTLLLKLGILSVVALTGAYNWLRVLPTLGDERGAQRIRKSATVELVVGVLVLAVTAVLVATPTGMDERMMGDGAMSHAGMDMSIPTSAPAAPPGSIANDTHATGGAADVPASDADQHFLRDLADQYEGMVYLSHGVMDRIPVGPAKDHAGRLDAEYDRDRGLLTEALTSLYADRHVVAPRPADRAAADSILRLQGPELARAFEARVAENHRRALATVDEFLPRLRRPEVAKLARRIRESQRRALAELGG